MSQQQSKSTDIFVGFEIGTGIPVFVPVFFTLVTGQTRLSGKTTALKALIQQAVKQGFKVLVLDTKTNDADYESVGANVPVCLEQTLDPLILRGLLESINERKITALQGTLIRIVENAKNFEDLIANAEELEAESRAGFVKDACVQLGDLLKRLLEQTKKVPSSSDLELPYQINRMPINDFDVPAQQLIARSVFSKALRNQQNLLIILDEASKFLPQKYSSACSRVIQEYVTQGGATKCFLWMGTQYLATTSKDAMKTMAVKLLGTQDHITECKHTFAMLAAPNKNMIISYDEGRRPVYLTGPEAFMRLKVGHFVVVTKEQCKAVYLCPDGADRNDCYQVALGRRNPRNINYVMTFRQDEVPTTQEAQEQITDELTVMPEAEHVAEATVKNYEEVGKEQPHAIFTEPENKTETQHECINAPKTEDAKVLMTQTAIGAGGFNTDIPKIEMAAISPYAQKVIDQFAHAAKLNIPMTIVKVEDPKRMANFTTDDYKGKIMLLAKQGFFSEWRGLKDVFEKFISMPWTVEYDKLKFQLQMMAKHGWLAQRKDAHRGKKEHTYSLPPNIIFEE